MMQQRTLHAHAKQQLQGAADGTEIANHRRTNTLVRHLGMIQNVSSLLFVYRLGTL